MTWEEFERQPDSDGFHREILRGVFQLLPLPTIGPRRIASNLLKKLTPLEPLGPGDAYVEAGYKLSHHPPTWIQPDASFLSAARVETDGDYFTCAPDLAVEIVSSSESAQDVELKAELMLEAGTQAIWVIYPETRTVRIFFPDGSSVKRGIGDSLTARFLSQDWSIPVADLFAD